MYSSHENPADSCSIFLTIDVKTPESEHMNKGQVVSRRGSVYLFVVSKELSRYT